MKNKPKITQTAYRKDQWYVSPWNFYPEVTKDFKFAKKILVHDVTLREGEQQTGIVYNRKDKVEIGVKLAEMGVDRIEAGMPSVSQQDEDAIKELVQMNLKPDIFAFCRCMASDIVKAKECGCKGAILEIACNPPFVKAAYGKTMDWAKKAAIEATQAAKELGLYVSFFTIDGTRTEIDVLLDVVDEIQTEGHMDAFVCADTFGCVHPQSVYHMISKIKNRFTVPVEAHMHMHFGLGAANTLAAVAAGADVVHMSVSGVGEGSGNTPLEDVVLGMKCLYGIETNVKTEKFTEISKFVCEKTNNQQLPPNRPIVGRDVFRVESGIGVMFFNNAAAAGDPDIVGSYQPGLVGQPDWEFVLGKKSGLASIDRALKDQNITTELTKEQKDEILQKIKALSIAEKRLVTSKEFKAFVDEALAAG